MKNIFKSIIITAVVSAVLTFLPSLLVTVLLEIDAVYALVYSLLVFILFMLVLPIPLFVSFKREQKIFLRLAKTLGTKCFIWKVGIYTREFAVNGYICFNNTCMHIVGKIKNREYNVILQRENTERIDIDGSVNIVIHMLNDKCYRLFSSKAPLIKESLEKSGWIDKPSDENG